MSNLGIRSAPVRWRDETGWELRCPDCSKRGQANHFWPLTDEFWNRRQMQRCLACAAVRRRQRDRARYWTNAEARARDLAQARRYKAEAGETIKVKRWVYYWSNADRERQRSREHYHANREAILARRRARAAEQPDVAA